VLEIRHLRRIFTRGPKDASAGNVSMKIKVVVHEAEEGGFWAEVPAIPGCATQGETMDELMRNLHEAIEGCLAVDVAPPKPGGKERILEIAL
jgi:predicted RNase H-like HicB family nuclease